MTALFFFDNCHIILRLLPGNTVTQHTGITVTSHIEETKLFNYRSIRNQMTISHLTLNLVAVAAAIILARPDKIRCYKTFADKLAA